MTHKEKKTDHAKEIIELEAKVVELEGKAEEAKDRQIRALADLDNMRKRSAIEREELVLFANEALISALLPIVDSFERALSTFEKIGTQGEVLKGFALIKKQFEDVLVRAGVKAIDAVGKDFDPHFHEAIMKKRTEGAKDNLVLEVAQIGYTLNGKIIRPAMVVISEA